MEKRIELEKRARKPNQITELNLDNCRSTSIVGLTDEYTALESLSLINVGLTTLKGFPKLPNLKKLELSDNRISNGLNYLTTSPKLQYLNLSGNKIKDLDALKPLEEFKNLAVLDLFNNEATQIGNYREEIFKMLPSLKFLDGFDCNDVEAPSDGDDDEEVNGNDSDDDVYSSSSENDIDDNDDDDQEECENEDDFDDDVSFGSSEKAPYDSDSDLNDIDEVNYDWEEEDEEEADEGDGAAGGKTNESVTKTTEQKVDGEEADGGGDEEPQARGKKRKHDG